MSDLRAMSPKQLKALKGAIVSFGCESGVLIVKSSDGLISASFLGMPDAQEVADMMIAMLADLSPYLLENMPIAGNA